MRVYLVRHGQSHENTADLRRALSLAQFREVLAESQQSALTPLGVEQAHHAAERLASLDMTHLYASPYLRAQQTATIIGARLGLPVITVAELHEVNPLIPPVLRRNRLRSLRSMYLRGYLHQMWPHRLPSGETWWQARRRVATVWRTLNAEWRPRDVPVLVAHRAFIWTTLRYLDRLPGWHVARRELDNAGISEVQQI